MSVPWWLIVSGVVIGLIVRAVHAANGPRDGRAWRRFLKGTCTHFDCTRCGDMVNLHESKHF